MIGDFLLVGVSDSFRNAKLLREKLNVYLSRLHGVDVIALNDVHGLVAGYFGKDSIADSLSPYMTLREKRKLVQAAKFTIYFWDGVSLTDFVYLSSLTSKPVKTVFVKTTRVVNRDKGEEFDVYIGRGTPWGNPFPIGEGGMDRKRVIEEYREYFKKRFIDDPQGNRDIRTLAGHVLGCHCKPEACHGDVIAEYLNSLEE